MCLVEVKGPRGFSLQPSCFLAVTPGMEVVTKSPKVKKAQDGVLEFLLINHPLDCPVCDKGGECPLQDQTLAYGPGESRFVEEKRHFEKPIALSDLVYLDRERCIQCDRCTRFADEVARDPLIEFVGRGDQTEVNTFPNGQFSSYFSGNTVQICPVGALTATPYRFKARPWDLEQVESTCTTCSMGCRIAVQSSRGEVTRYLGIDSEAVNQSWLCDLGRFSFEALDSQSRLTEPTVRHHTQHTPVSWRDAIGRIGAHVRKFKKESGPTSIGFIGGSTFSNEGIYSWVKLAKSIIGTDNFDADLPGTIDPSLIFGLRRATIESAAKSKLLVVLSGDIREEIPVLFLRLAEAAKAGVEIIEISEVETSITQLAQTRLSLSTHQFAAELQACVGVNQTPLLAPLFAAISGAGVENGEDMTILIGKSNLAESSRSLNAATLLFSQIWPEAKFLFTLGDSNIFGAMDLGAIPGFLPGRRRVTDNATLGLSTTAMLVQATKTPMLLFILGSDPFGDVGDTALVERALRNSTVVAVSSFATRTCEVADVVVPLAAFAESAGTTTNFEGRVSRLGQALVPKGQSKPDYLIAFELARELGASNGPSDLEGIFAEMERELALYRGLSYFELGSPRSPDGVVVPLLRTKVEITTTTSKRLDPMATPGLIRSDRQKRESFSVSDVDHNAEKLPDSTEIPILEILLNPPVPDFDETNGAAPGSFRLLLSKRLYSPSAVLGAAPILSRLTAFSSVHLSAAAMSRLNVVDGDTVTVEMAGGDTLQVVVHLNKSLADEVIYGYIGEGANLLALVDSSKAQNYVKVGNG